MTKSLIKSLFSFFLIAFLLPIAYEQIVNALYPTMSIVTSVIILLFAQGVVTLFLTTPFKRYGIQKPNQKSWLKGGILTAFASLAISLLMFILGIEEIHPILIHSSVLSAFFIIGVLAPIGEELLYRGYIQTTLSCFNRYRFEMKAISISLPVLISSIIFAIAHLQLLLAGVTISFMIMILISTFIVGLITGYYREKTESLFPSILMHALFNIVSYFVYLSTILN